MPDTAVSPTPCRYYVYYVIFPQTYTPMINFNLYIRDRKRIMIVANNKIKQLPQYTGIKLGECLILLDSPFLNCKWIWVSENEESNNLDNEGQKSVRVCLCLF